LIAAHDAPTIRSGENFGTSNYHRHVIEVNINSIVNAAKDNFWDSRRVSDPEFSEDIVNAPPVPDIEPRRRVGLKDPHHFVEGWSKLQIGQQSGEGTGTIVDDNLYGVFGDGGEYDEPDSIFRDGCLLGQNYTIDVHGASDNNSTFNSRLGSNVYHEVIIGTNDGGDFGISKYNMATVERVARTYLKSKGYNGTVCINGAKYRARFRAMARHLQENGIKSFQIEFSRTIRNNWITIDIPELLRLMAIEFVKTN
jgi:hypothetical protein